MDGVYGGILVENLDHSFYNLLYVQFSNNLINQLYRNLGELNDN